MTGWHRRVGEPRAASTACGSPRKTRAGRSRRCASSTWRPATGVDLHSGPDELIVLPLAGACTVTCEGADAELAGRPSVFAQVSDFAYVPRQSTFSVAPSERGGRSALPGARARHDLAFRRQPADVNPVELRGAGPAVRARSTTSARPRPSRRPPDRLRGDHPGRQLVVVPPHKHDEQREGKSALEEIYYYEVADGPAGPGTAYAAGLSELGGAADRGPRRGALRRRRADPARLARPVDGGARLRPVLPQRHGGPGPRARLVHLRRPGAQLGPRHVAGPARRPAPAAHDKRRPR